MEANEPTRTHRPNRDDIALNVASGPVPPSPRQAAHFIRDVGWNDRLTGWVCSSSAGSMPQWLTQAEHVRNFLLAPSDEFVIDLRDLGEWVRNVLDDQELANRIGQVIDDVPTDDEDEIRNRVWDEADPERREQARAEANARLSELKAARDKARSKVSELLAERISQARGVLEEQDE